MCAFTDGNFSRKITDIPVATVAVLSNGDDRVVVQPSETGDLALRVCIYDNQ